MLKEVNEDLNRAIDLSFNKNDIRYSKIYPHTNENLKQLFANFDVRDKEVLSVLGSSDHVFWSLCEGAKNVDTFDINKLTIYYYYLRKWVIKYQKRLYPVDSFFYYGDIDTYLLIANIKPNSNREAAAQHFWLNYLRRTNGLPQSYLFYNMALKYPILDISRLKSVIEEDPIYINCNIYKNLDIEKQYDVIILSNILEYTITKKDYETVANNIKRLLKDDGICVCSYCMNSHLTGEHLNEQLIMENMGLRIKEFYSYYKNEWGLSEEVGYTYVKK